MHRRDPSPTPTRSLTWRRTLPTRPGTYRLWDPDRGINRLVPVFCARGGRLAVRNPCACCAAFFLDMWLEPGFEHAQWLGPIDVPSALPRDLGRGAASGDTAGLDRRVRLGTCLLGRHD